MRTFTIALAALVLAGCGSSSSSTNSEPADPNAEQIAKKQQELRQVDRDLGIIRDERNAWNKMSPSEEKNKRLADLAAQEKDLMARGGALRNEIAQLEGTAPPAPVTADDAFGEMDAATKTQEQELAEKIRLQAESEEQRRLADAAAAKAADLERMKREKADIEAATRNTGGDAIFEEKWADVILKVKAELQRYKRW